MAASISDNLIASSKLSHHVEPSAKILHEKQQLEEWFLTFTTNIRDMEKRNILPLRNAGELTAPLPLSTAKNMPSKNTKFLLKRRQKSFANSSNFQVYRDRHILRLNSGNKERSSKTRSLKDRATPVEKWNSDENDREFSAPWGDDLFPHKI